MHGPMRALLRIFEVEEAPVGQNFVTVRVSFGQGVSVGSVVATGAPTKGSTNHRSTTIKNNIGFDLRTGPAMHTARLGLNYCRDSKRLL